MGMVLAEGAVVGQRYTLVGRLAEGGMGEVWIAQHTVTKRRVAIKFLKEGLDEQARRRVIREAQAACAIEHDAVLPIHDVLEMPDGEPALVMDLLQGESLEQRLTREKKLSATDVATLFLPVAEALAQAHALGLVHRDLKPANLFLTKAGAVKVLDFGIVKAVDGVAAEGPDTTTGKLIGTPRYMSPEQAAGERDIDARSDVWSLGIVLFEALTGERAVKGDNLGQVLKVLLVGKVKPLREVDPTLPEPLLALVDRMTDRDAATRLVTMNDVADVLRGLARPGAGAPLSRPSEPSLPSASPSADGKPIVVVATTDPSTVGPTTLPRARAAASPWMLGAGAIVVAGAVVGTVLLVGKGDPKTASSAVASADTSAQPGTAPPAMTPSPSPLPAASSAPAPSVSAPPAPPASASTDPGTAAPRNYDPTGPYCRANPKNATCAAALKRWCSADPKNMASSLCN